MAVTTTQDRVTYQGDGISTIFAIPFYFIKNVDLIVIRTLVATGVQNTLVLNTDYSLAGADVPSGGSLTLLAGALALGYSLSIILSPALTQQSNYPSNSPFPSVAVQNDFDRHMQILQRLSGLLARAIIAPDGDTNPTMQLPGAAARANLALVFDNNGNAVVGIPVSQTLTQALIGTLLFPQTPAEANGAVTPATLYLPPPNAFRYSVDGTGTNDSTTAMQGWINASWAQYYYLDGQGLWNGGGQAVPIPTLPPGKYKVGTSGSSLLLPSGITLSGNAHPANTVSHTRLVMNSTGLSPAATWTANTGITSNQFIQPTTPNGFYYQANNTGVFLAGTTGSSQPTWPTTINQTVVDGTVTWTCVAQTQAGDNRNTPMFKLSRATHPGGAVLQNQSWTGTIERLEFWGISQSNSFNNPLSGNGIPFGSYPLGGTLYIDCDMADTRIVSCCFQNNPCGIRIHNAKSGQVASDGFTNTSGVVLYVEECEFDAATAHVYADNSNLDLTFKNCSFFSGIHKYVGCTGRVRYLNCRFFGGAFIDASDSGNAFESFVVNGGEIDQYNGADTLSVYKATLIDVKGVIFAHNATPYSTVVANYCSSGQISGNSINDSGFNTNFTTGGLTAAAAIKLIDCQNLLVAKNNLTATDAATYGGFGILTLTNTRGSSGNFITDNCISAPYTGAAYNSQHRSINAASAADIVGVNYNANNSSVAQGYGPVAKTPPFGVTYSASMTWDARAADEFDITATNNTAFTINAPLNPTTGQVMTVMIRNASGGALGTATWNSVFKLFAWTQPNNGGSLSITFRFDGTNWVELYRGLTTVPN